MYAEEFDSFRKHADLKLKPAGLEQEGYDNSGMNMKEVMTLYNRGDSAVIVPFPNATKMKIPLQHDRFKKASSPDHNPCFLHMDKNKALIDDVIDLKPKKYTKEKNVLEVLWNTLKMKNHTNFRDLLSAFNAYKRGKDRITVSDLQNMCQNYGISVPLHILEKLLKECDIIEKDGTISYEEFIHCLNWKDKLPENCNAQTVPYANDWREGINNPSYDVIDHYRTTSSFIGDHTYAARLDGVQRASKTSDNIRNVDSIGKIIQPSIFAQYGVDEMDLGALRSKQEVKTIFMKSGIALDSEVFEKVWENVSYNEKASIGSVWNVLKSMCLTQKKLFPY